MADKADKQEKEMSKEERIGYHKGAINTLLGERTELLRMVQMTDSLIQAHVKELEGLGVKMTEEKPKK